MHCIQKRIIYARSCRNLRRYNEFLLTNLFSQYKCGNYFFYNITSGRKDECFDLTAIQMLMYKTIHNNNTIVVVSTVNKKMCSEYVNVNIYQLLLVYALLLWIFLYLYPGYMQNKIYPIYAVVNYCTTFLPSLYWGFIVYTLL